MTHLPDLIADLGLILGAAAIITILFKWLKQPLVLGYLIAGFLVGPHFHFLPTVAETENIHVWAEIGVIFLLFSLGLEFSFKKLMRVGVPASLTAIVEVVGMLLIGYVTGTLLGWSKMDSIFLGGVLSISSTTIIIRAFEELGLKGQLFAGLVFGILIVEDLVAIVLLVLLSTLAVSSQFAGAEMLFSVAKLLFFLVLWFVSGIFFLPTLLRWAKSILNDELLLITSLALCMLMVWLATAVGFSPALGAFVMGSILAETVYAEKIEHLVKSVRDLFGAVFFVSVGMLFDPAMMVTYAWPILLITLVTVSGKFLTSLAGALLSGQPLKRSVQAGLSLAQIGEFSFIIATLGLSLGVTSDFLYPVAVAVSAITTFTTPYLIKLAIPLHRWLNRVLPQSWQNAINRYSTRAQEQNKTSEWQQYFRSWLMNTALLSILIAALVLVSSYYVLPYTRTQLGDTTWATLAAGGFTLLVMAPLLWSLAIVPHRSERVTSFTLQNKYKGSLFLFHFLRIAIAIFLIGFFLDRFLSPRVALIVTVVLLGALLLLSRKVQLLYGRIRNQFMLNLNEREVRSTPSALAPWDAHLANFEISPEWPGIGKTLQELGWRERFGINVARITRADLVINTPGKEERLFPLDKLAVIGTDEQVAIFNQELKMLAQARQKRHAIVLDQLSIPSNSNLVGKSIRESGIREKTHGIVVGIESQGRRIVNPESQVVLQAGDTVWLVGDQLRLIALRKSFDENGNDPATHREVE